MKPIEEGCLALIIHSVAGNSGVVKVGKFIGMCGFDIGEDYWEVDRPMKCYYLNGSEAPASYTNREINLMRIDGEEFKEELQQEKIKEQTNE